MIPAVLSAPFPLATGISNRLGDALRWSALREGSARNELQSAIQECVDSLRVQGMSPEAALITLRCLVTHLARTGPERVRSLETADELMNDIVHFCVTAYFRANEA